MSPAVLIARMTVGQVLGLRRFVGLTALGVLPAGIFYLTTARATAGSRLETFTGLTVGLFFAVVVPVIALILTTSALGDERRDHTLPFITLRPIRRSAIAAAKVAGAAAAAGLVSGIGALALGVAMGARGGGWGYVIPVLIGTLVATAAYAGLFTPLGYLTERATLAGLAYVFIWESAVAGTVAALAATSLWRIGLSALVGLAPTEMEADLPGFALGSVAPGAGGAALKATALLVVGTAVITMLLRRRDQV